jgi:spore germination cell wall hydrolase CwlJ-like protein
LLSRSIELDPFDLSIEEKLFLGAKRVCVVFAVAALSLSTLDLMNIRPVESAAIFIHDHRTRLADLPHVIRAGISEIAIAAPAATATALIPRDAIPLNVASAQPEPATATAALLKDDTIAPLKADIAAPFKNEASPVAGLAAARHQDAVETAMVQPVRLTKSDSVPMAALDLAPANAPAAAPQPTLDRDLKLASLDTAAMPQAQPASLPMANAFPSDLVPMPRPAPPQSPAQLLHLDENTYAKAERCLANAVYFEARSEPVRGQMAVAQVVMNRVFSGFYPHDVCAVVYQNANRHLACQFTFACDGKRKVINERGAWARANRIAKQTLDGELYEAAVGASTHYHALYVHPNWVREMHRLVRYGEHLFYRPIAWGNGSYEKAWGAAALAQNKEK